MLCIYSWANDDFEFERTDLSDKKKSQFSKNFVMVNFKKFDYSTVFIHK